MAIKLDENREKNESKEKKKENPNVISAAGEGEEQKKFELVAPDGGWGWIIVVAYGLSNVVVIPLIQSFGLIFLDRFNELNFTSTDITTLISLNSWFGMIIGIFNGHLLKKFGFRKVAFAGISFFSTGFFLTGFATSYLHFVLSWGLLASVGFIWLMASFSFALNSYFKVNRSHASGRGSFLTGLGPILMPLLISFLLKGYGVKWAVVILTGVNLHSFIGASLLQPVKRHMKLQEIKPIEPKKKSDIIREKAGLSRCFPCLFQRSLVEVTLEEEPSEVEPEPKEEKPIEFADTVSLFGGSLSGSRRSLYRRPSATPSAKWSSQDYLQKIGGVRPYTLIRSYSESNAKKRVGSIECLDNDDHDNMLRSMIHLLEKPIEERERIALASMESLDFEDHKTDSNKYLKGSNKRLISISSIEENNAGEIEESNFSDKGPERRRSSVKPLIKSIQENYEKEVEEEMVLDNEKAEDEEEEEKKGCLARSWDWIKETYDLDLLKDVVYLNITIGMSIAIIGELMFSLLTPFILNELGLDLDEKATFMSVVAISDIASRSVAPYAGDFLKFGSRAMYVTALFLLFITRGLMFLPTTYEGFLAVAVALGLAKGVRTVYWALVIPDYVPLKKYPSAAAIQSLANGILLALSGPIIGAIISISGSYSNAIIACNVLTLVTVAMWYIEFGFVAVRDRRRKKKSKNEGGSES